VVVLVGPGNNGGDGLVTARHLHDAGAHVTLYIWKRTPTDKDVNWQRCRERGLTEITAEDDSTFHRLREVLRHAHLVIDALLGMGVTRPVTGTLAEIVALVNQSRAARSYQVLSIDMPTGISSDTGAILEAAIYANITVATGLPKRGLLLYPGRVFAGQIMVAEIGIPPDDLENIMSKTISREQASKLLPPRPDDAHKGTFGKVLVVAGSLKYPGAAVLATAGAARAGAGLVTLAAARSIVGGGGRNPEITLLPLPEGGRGTVGAEAAKEVLEGLEGYQALLVGPGIGQEEPTKEFLQRLLGMEEPRARSRVGFRVQTEEERQEEEQRSQAQLPPMVLDADALNILAGIENWHERLPAERCILTPHPGEMKRLLGTDELQADVVQVATDAARRWRQVVVLKGATTVIAAPDGSNAVHAAGNPALATAGTGDVLSGCITGLLAQGLKLKDAALLGVYLHGAAGDLLREEMGDMGTLASDLLPLLPRAIKELKGQ
jgi:NAD(P)H-hydrate epimerase